MTRLTDEQLQQYRNEYRGMSGTINSICEELLLARKVIEQSREIAFVFGGGGGMENVIGRSDLRDLKEALEAYDTPVSDIAVKVKEQ